MIGQETEFIKRYPKTNLKNFSGIIVVPVERLEEESGATILEFALGSIFFFFFLFGIFEVSRILAVRALIIKGAQDAAVLAAQHPDIDISYPVISGGAPVLSSPQYQRYFLARQRIIDEAVRTPLSTFVASPAVCPGGYLCEPRPVAQRLQTLNTFDLPVPSGLGGGVVSVDAVLLRPDQTDILIGYPQRDRYGVLTGASVRYPSDFNIAANQPASLPRRLRDFPLVVEVHADVEPLVAFLGSIRLVARATSFREPPPESSLSQLNISPFPSSTTTTAPPTTLPPTTTTVSTTPSTTLSQGSTTTTAPTTTGSTTNTSSTTTTTLFGGPSTTLPPPTTTTSTTTTSTLCPQGTPARLLSPGACFNFCSPRTMENFVQCTICQCGGG